MHLQIVTWLFVIKWWHRMLTSREIEPVVTQINRINRKYTQDRQTICKENTYLSHHSMRGESPFQPFHFIIVSKYPEWELITKILDRLLLTAWNKLILLRVSFHRWRLWSIFVENILFLSYSYYYLWLQVQCACLLFVFFLAILNMFCLF